MFITSQLEDNTLVFKNLFGSKEESFILWKPFPEKWNLLEIVCHLRDEEKEDFRARVFSVLEDPRRELTPIDPVGWVKSRKYGEQTFEKVVAEFLEERARCVEMLRTLTDPRWDNAYNHPKLGPMTAWLFLTNWLAHDYLHIKQITRLRYDYLQGNSGEELSYAGNWI
jgi:hypothetical protein